SPPLDRIAAEFSKTEPRPSHVSVHPASAHVRPRRLRARSFFQPNTGRLRGLFRSFVPRSLLRSHKRGTEPHAQFALAGYRTLSPSRHGGAAFLRACCSIWLRGCGGRQSVPIQLRSVLLPSSGL